MNSLKSFYVTNKKGRILRSGFCATDDFEFQKNNDDEMVFEGQANPIEQYVKDNKIVNIPPAPSKYHTWSFDDFEWKLDSERLVLIIREQRNVKLLESDWVDLPISQERLSAQRLLEWQNYRQALRDITKQTNLANVVWPTPPTE